MLTTLLRNLKVQNSLRLPIFRFLISGLSLQKYEKVQEIPPSSTQQPRRLRGEISNPIFKKSGSPF
jgi:hypothetical protein